MTSCFMGASDVQGCVSEGKSAKILWYADVDFRGRSDGLGDLVLHVIPWTWR